MQKRNRFIIISIKIIAVMLISVCLLFAAMNLVSLIPSRAIFEEIKNIQSVAPISSTFSKEKSELTKTDNSDYNILHITDAHVVCSIFSPKKDKNIVKTIRGVVENSKPDLIVLTGDMLFPAFYAGGSNNKIQLEAVVTMFDAFEVPWTFVYGNHDADIWGIMKKKDISKELSESAFCLFDTGITNISGEGNYAVTLLNNDLTINTVLFMMDTNSKNGFTYGGIADDQISWYEQEINRFSAIKGTLVSSMLFVHIPLPEYQDAWDAYANGQPEAKYIFGTNKESISPGKEKSKMFDKIYELHSTKAVFSGHDHANTWTIKYKGVYLSYGLAVDHTSYSAKTNTTRGGQLIAIKPDSTFSLFHVHEMSGFAKSQNCCSSTI